MQTSLEKLNAAAEKLTDDAHDFFGEHSRLVSDPVNPPGSMVLHVGIGDYVWMLKEGGEPHRVRILHLLEILQTHVVAIAPSSEIQARLENSITECCEYLRPGSRHFHAHINIHQDGFATCIDQLSELAESLPDYRAGCNLLVPDTSALIANPDIETWRFAGVDKFTLVFVPQVLRELEKLKSRHDKNSTTREDSAKIIRKLRDCRGGGKLTEGVAIGDGTVTILTSGIEADFSRTLKWLVESVDDDKILACAVEVVRKHPKCAVGIVTGDFNFQNKIELAQIDYFDPADTAPPLASITA